MLPLFIQLICKYKPKDDKTMSSFFTNIDTVLIARYNEFNNKIGEIEVE